MTGWASLHRSILGSNIFANEKLLKVFIWCLMKATHADFIQLVGRQQVHLKPGQFVTGRSKAGSELNMPPSTAWDYLRILDDMETITISSNNKFSIVTVVNWEVYQVNNKKTDNKSTTDKQQINTNNNSNNINNNNKEQLDDISEGEDDVKKDKIEEHLDLRYGHNDINYKIALHLREQVLDVNPKCRVPKPEPKHMQKWADEIRKMMQYDKVTKEEMHQAIKFIYSDNFWDTVIQSPSGLRRNWNTISGQMIRSNKNRTSNVSNQKSKFAAFDKQEIDFEELERLEQENIDKMLREG